MKKSVVMFSLLLGVLITPTIFQSQNISVMGKVSENTSKTTTKNIDSNESSGKTRKLNFMLGGGETGRIEKTPQEKNDNLSESSSGQNPVNNLTTSLLPNAKRYLLTATYDSSAQATHPSVVDFKLEYGIEK